MFGRVEKLVDRFTRRAGMDRQKADHRTHVRDDFLELGDGVAVRCQHASKSRSSNRVEAQPTVRW